MSKENILIAQVNISLTRAQWWIAATTNGVAINRNMSHGYGGEQLTDQEKIKEAMDTANRHTDHAQKCLDEMNLLYYTK